MELVLHIGAHKSGSTAIQRMCTVAEAELVRSGIYYPRGLFPKYPDQHSELAALLRSGSDDDVRSALAEAIRRARGASCTRIFLSGEDFCTKSSDGEVDRLARLVRERFTAARAVLIHRVKKDYLLSHYNHMLRHVPEVIGIEGFKKRVRFNPAAVLARWRKRFGEDNVSVVPYEVPGGAPLLERFFGGVFGFAPPPKALAQCQGVNASLDFVSAIIINEVIKVLPGFDMASINRAYAKSFVSRNQRLPFLEHDLGVLLDQSFSSAEWEVGTGAAASGKEPAPLSAQQAAHYLASLSRFLAVLADAAQDHSGELTRDDVIAAYRILLDRMPENEAVVDYALACGSLRELREAILDSPEYRHKNGPVGNPL